MATPVLFERLYDLPLSTYVRESLYLYPALDVLHIVGVLLLLGSIVVVDLRLLGRVFGEVPISKLSAQVLPLSFIGAALAFASGGLLFLAEAEHIWNNPMLQVKFALLALAAINVGAWHVAFARHQAQWDALPRPPLQAKIAGASSLLLWSAILVFGRLIAFIF